MGKWLAPSLPYSALLCVYTTLCFNGFVLPTLSEHFIHFIVDSISEITYQLHNISSQTQLDLFIDFIRSEKLFGVARIFEHNPRLKKPLPSRRGHSFLS
ncbi:MAG: hypothetical protein K2V38_06210, partial [Gemmataceae bacterium]|nr:hypothetical protein [Gemmataceae bacterium]